MNSSWSLVQLQAQIYTEMRAGQGPVERLMPWLLDRRNLEGAWERVSGTDGANTPGVDGISCADVAKRPAVWLAELANDLLHGHYLPQPPRWVEVPKRTGSADKRRLGILAIRDRVVHAALKQVLEPILETSFMPASYGFRPGRSVPAALADAGYCMLDRERTSLRFPFAVHVDVKNCFDTIDHEQLLNQLRRHVGDEALIELVQTTLRAGGTTVRRWWRPSRMCGLSRAARCRRCCATCTCTPWMKRWRIWAIPRRGACRPCATPTIC